jgi:hypothetical protein
MKINFKILFPFIILFIFTTNSIIGQSKFEYGIGIMINHSKIDEKSITQFGLAEETNKGLRLLAVTTRIGYKFTDRFHLNSGIGFSWLGSLRKDLSSRIVASTIAIPLQLEFNPWKSIHFSSGLNYNYVYGISAETNQTENSLMSIINSKHQLGLKHGIAISHQHLELSVSYAHYFTDLFILQLTDANGNDIGTSFSKFRNIQLGLIFRG